MIFGRLKFAFRNNALKFLNTILKAVLKTILIIIIIFLLLLY